MQVLYSLVIFVPFLLAIMKSTTALPNPDFGVNATINPARLDVLAEASRLLVEFNAVSNVSVTLISNTPILTQMESAILSIASKFSTSGVTLTQLLQTLATDNGPSISGVFNPVYEAIAALKDLTINGLSDEMMSITEVVPTFVTQKFNQVFGDVRKALNQLSNKLMVLERDVTKARTAAGNAPHVSNSIIRNNVPARVQSDVTRAIIGLRLKIDSVKYMVRTTLLYLQDADEFLVDVTDEVNSFANAVSTSLFQFDTKLTAVMQKTVNYTFRAFECSREELDASLEQIMPPLSSITNFSSTLQPPLEGFRTQLSEESLTLRVNEFLDAFQTYNQSIVSTSSNIEPFMREVTCALLRNIVLTLISFGPENVFCFNRFAAHVYGLYDLHYSSVSRCYEAELARLTTMAKFLRDTVDVLLYDVEDLADLFSVCVVLSEDQTFCAQDYGMRNGALLSTFTSMLDDIGRLYVEEFAASFTRFGVCVSSSQQMTLNYIAKIDQRLGTCQSMN